MNIIMINFMETTDPGGINKTIKELGKNLSKKGHQITVIQPNLFNYSNNQVYEGFNIIRVNSLFKNYLYGFSLEIFIYLKKNFKKLDPDIIHIHGYQSLLLPEIIFLIKIMQKKIPIILTPHYDPLNRGTKFSKIFGSIYDQTFGKRILNFTDKIISISDFEAQSIKKINSSKSITVIPHGVNQICKKKKTNDFTLNLLYVGYLLDYKGVQFIITAVERLIKVNKIENLRLTIVGEGKYKRKLLELAKKLEINDFIDWKPFLPHEIILKEMEKCDIFLLLSKTEGYGIVVAEALSVGTPSIVTNGTALEEFTKENGCYSIDYPPESGEVADLIIKIYENNVNVGPFSEKIRTWDKVAENYEDVYYEILGE